MVEGQVLKKLEAALTQSLESRLLNPEDKGITSGFRDYLLT